MNKKCQLLILLLVVILCAPAISSANEIENLDEVADDTSWMSIRQYDIPSDDTQLQEPLLPDISDGVPVDASASAVVFSNGNLSVADHSNGITISISTKADGKLFTPKKVSADKESQKIRYEDDNVISEYKYSEKLIKETITLKKETSLSFDLSTTGRFVERRGDDIVIHKGQWFNGIRLLKPYGTDSSGKYIPMEYQINGSTLALVYDTSGISYPLTIDPTVSVGGVLWTGILGMKVYSDVSTTETEVPVRFLIWRSYGGNTSGNISLGTSGINANYTDIRFTDEFGSVMYKYQSNAFNGTVREFYVQLPEVTASGTIVNILYGNVTCANNESVLSTTYNVNNSIVYSSDVERFPYNIFDPATGLQTYNPNTTISYSETFAGDNETRYTQHKTITGTGWLTPTSAEIAVGGGMINLNSANGNQIFTTLRSYRFSDGMYKADFVDRSTGGVTKENGLIFGWQDNQSYYIMNLTDTLAGAKNLSFWKMSAGTSTLIGTIYRNNTGYLTYGNLTTLEVQWDKNHGAMYGYYYNTTYSPKNTTANTVAYDATFSSGRFGVRSGVSTVGGLNVNWDNYEIRADCSIEPTNVPATGSGFYFRDEFGNNSVGRLSTTGTWAVSGGVLSCTAAGNAIMPFQTTIGTHSFLPILANGTDYYYFGGYRIKMVASGGNTCVITLETTAGAAQGSGSLTVTTTAGAFANPVVITETSSAITVTVSGATGTISSGTTTSTNAYPKFTVGTATCSFDTYYFSGNRYYQTPMLRGAGIGQYYTGSSTVNATRWTDDCNYNTTAEYNTPATFDAVNGFSFTGAGYTYPKVSFLRGTIRYHFMFSGAAAGVSFFLPSYIKGFCYKKSNNNFYANGGGNTLEPATLSENTWYVFEETFDGTTLTHTVRDMSGTLMGSLTYSGTSLLTPLFGGIDSAWRRVSATTYYTRNIAVNGIESTSTNGVACTLGGVSHGARYDTNEFCGIRYTPVEGNVTAWQPSYSTNTTYAIGSLNGNLTWSFTNATAALSTMRNMRLGANPGLPNITGWDNESFHVAGTESVFTLANFSKWSGTDYDWRPGTVLLQSLNQPVKYNLAMTPLMGNLTVNFTANITNWSQYAMATKFTQEVTNATAMRFNLSYGDGRWYNTTSWIDPTFQYSVANRYTVALTARNLWNEQTLTKNYYINLSSDDDKYLKSWLHMNGLAGCSTFIGEKGNAWSSYGGVQISCSTYQFGLSSGYFPSASNSYIASATSAAWNFSTGNFTIEFWANVTSTGSGDCIVSRTTNPSFNDGWGFYHVSGASSNTWCFRANGVNSPYVTIPIDTWTHVAIERTNGVVQIYINGVASIAPTTMNGNYDTINPIHIGRRPVNYYYNGYLDEFRISNATRWYADFSTPYAQYNGDLYSQLNQYQNATMRYKSNPENPPTLFNQSNGGVRNRTLQIQNVSSANYTIVAMTFPAMHVRPLSFGCPVVVNQTTYSDTTIVSQAVTVFDPDTNQGVIEFNVTRTAGFTSLYLNRTSIVDTPLIYWNYSSPDDIEDHMEYFGSAYRINSTTGVAYPFYNFIGTRMNYGRWNFSANFTADKWVAMQGEMVQFSDWTAGHPSRWYWDYGDGDSTTATNNNTVGHSFTAIPFGLMNVTLVGYLWQNASVSNAISHDVRVYENLSADFTANQTIGSVTLHVGFVDLSNNATSWQWDFGDGTTSVEQNPGHAYATPGTYTVNLTVGNGDMYNIVSKHDFIVAGIMEEKVPLIVPQFYAYPRSGEINVTVNFTDQSIPYNCNITAWNWSLGDGNTSTDQNPVHPYGVGVWNVTLEVSSLGRTWNLTKTNYINITLPAVVAETQPIIILSASDNNWTIGLVGCIGIIGLLGLIFRRK